MRAIIIALLMLVPLPIGAATNVLENDEIRLEVSSQNGSIIHLVDKRTQTDYVADPKQARLFRFLLPKPDFTARRGYGHTLREIYAHEQKADSVEVVDGALKIRYSELQVSPQRVGYMMVKTPEGPPLRYPIEVTGRFARPSQYTGGKPQLRGDHRRYVSLAGWVGADVGRTAGKDGISFAGPKVAVGRCGFRRSPGGS